MKNSLVVMTKIITICLTVLLYAACQDTTGTPPATPENQNLKNLHDEELVLNNPHKGWFHHYYDDFHIKYPIKKDSYILKFPGFNHMYFRIPWGHLETEDDVYNWEVIDDVIDKWWPEGISVAFQVTCKETYNAFQEPVVAVPQWLIDAGAAGEMFSMPDWNAEFWEPDYADPLLLEKLEEFHEAFAERYDGKVYVEYIDIGSYGSWGEGHNWPKSMKVWPPETIIKHLNIYLNCYKESRLTLSEDWIDEHRSDEDARVLKAFVDSVEIISWRDNSILVDYWIKNLPKEQYSVKRPGYYEETYQFKPVTIELEHYPNLKRAGNWSVPDGIPVGEDVVLGALNLMHATWIGFHGPPDEYLTENPVLTKKVANLVGYWYFPVHLEVEGELTAGGDIVVSLTWENRGVAPAYHKYLLDYKIESQDGSVSYHGNFQESDNRTWMPGKHFVENYSIQLPDHFNPGDYIFKIRMYDPLTESTVYLGLKNEILDLNDYYMLASWSIE